jgi:predicted kinase
VAAPRGRLIVICGLPGTGKTTLSTALVEKLGATLFASDDWLSALRLDMWDHETRDRVEGLQWEMAKVVLTLGGTAVIDWGSWARVERDALRTGARELDAAVELYYLTAPPEVLYERISRRGRENPPITLEMLTDWAGQFEVPTDEEIALYDPSPDRGLR